MDRWIELIVHWHTDPLLTGGRHWKYLHNTVDPHIGLPASAYKSNDTDKAFSTDQCQSYDTEAHTKQTDTAVRHTLPQHRHSPQTHAKTKTHTHNGPTLQWDTRSPKPDKACTHKNTHAHKHARPHTVHGNLVVELAVDGVSLSVDQLEGVRAIAVHVAMAVGNTAVAEEEGHLRHGTETAGKVTTFPYAGHGSYWLAT